MVRTRLSPSPTGPLHIGTARTALFNWLYSRQRGGVFILRIEDTDHERSKPEFEKNILELLHWLGLSWDEGPDTGGPSGPYRQSQRSLLYKTALEKLYAAGSIYPCFCLKAELEAERASQLASKQPPRYSGKCRQTADEASRRLAKGEAAVWRFKIPEPARVVTWDDLIRGTTRVHTKELDDFIIAQSFDRALYNFAVVVDDAAMEITDVLRGEDHISNTPKQLLLQDALGLPHPNYGHIPLILNSDRSKMSKRQGNVDLEFYRSAGYVPAAMLNFLALLGWNPGDNREIFSLENLISDFSIQRVQKAGAVFNIEKLQWLNSQYIRTLPEESVRDLVLPYIPEIHRSDPRTIAILEVVRGRMKILSEFWELTSFFYEGAGEYPPERLIWKFEPSMSNESFLQTKTSLCELSAWLTEQTFDWGPMMLEGKIKAWILGSSKKAGDVLWPMRVALSGREASPSPFEIAGILGKDETLRRLNQATAKLTK